LWLLKGEEKMSAGRWLALIIALYGCLAFTAAEAAPAKKKARGPLPIASGCTHTVAPFCLGITSGRTTYALLGANPFIPPGIGVTVWGTVTSISPCGTAISVTKWQRNKLKCRA
jgi:hypothetical protein